MPHVCILSSVHSALDNRVFYREAQSLRNAGYTVTLIAVYPSSITKNGVKIIGLPQVPRWQRPRLWWRLMQCALAEKADIYHFHDPELLLVTPWLRWYTGKPTIYDIHEVYADFLRVKDYMPTWIRNPTAFIFRWLEPLLARLQSALIFSDGEIAKNFRNINLPKETLYNFPSITFVKQGIAQTNNYATRSPIVLHLGGLERNRGTELIIDAFAQVFQKFPKARLLLVGKYTPPDLVNEVRNHAKSNGISDAVTITGQIPFEMIGRYLKQAAVGWVPWQPYPKNEKNIPTKLFEYMSYAVPIVSSDLASTRPFIANHNNGYLVNATDPTAHAHAILNILQNPQNGMNMGRRGQILTKTQYNWDTEEKKLWSLYESLLP